MAQPYASYRRLRDNAKAAMLAAVEVCNKPALDYREECSVILLTNAWELLLKAVLAKNGRTIFYKKDRRQPYRTFTIKDAMDKCTPLLPPKLAPRAIRGNLSQLVLYRDNAVHFYNQKGFRVLLLGLAQTAVKNFNDVLIELFDQTLGEQLPGTMLPIGLEPPLDPITFLKALPKGGRAPASPSTTAVLEFVKLMRDEVSRLEEDGVDTARFLTTYSVKLESTKKIQSSDFVVGVKSDGDSLLVHGFKDPNNYPYREKDILAMNLKVGDVEVGTTAFRAVVRTHGIKHEIKYCWVSDVGGLTKYSSEMPRFITRLSTDELAAAISEYRNHLSTRRKKNRR